MYDRGSRILEWFFSQRVLYLTPESRNLPFAFSLSLFNPFPNHCATLFLALLLLNARTKHPRLMEMAATWNREFKLLWCEAGPPNHLDDKVDSDQEVGNKDVSLYRGRR